MESKGLKDDKATKSYNLSQNVRDEVARIAMLRHGGNKSAAAEELLVLGLEALRQLIIKGDSK